MKYTEIMLSTYLKNSYLTEHLTTKKEKILSFLLIPLKCQ